MHRSRLLAFVLATVVAIALASPAAAQDGSTVVVTSFDGAEIEASLFIPAGASEEDPVPLILRTHGWAGSRQTEPDGAVGRFLDAGYAVMTWDSRGFGCSGGLVRIDKPDFEGRDVSALIDHAVANAPIATDDEGDPLVGMSGGSYAGGIQLAASAVDDRIDVLAPEIAWSDLRYSLYAGEVVKQGWVAILYGAGVATASGQDRDPSCEADGTGSGLHPQIHSGVTEFMATGTVSQQTLDFFADSSLHHFGEERPVELPTLVVQGSVDTLFDLTDGAGIASYTEDRGAPTRFLIFCGGHVACPSSYEEADDDAVTDEAVLDWFARYIDGEDVDTGAPVTYRTNEGVWRSTDAFPPSDATGEDVVGEVTDLPVVPVLDFPGLESAIEEFQQSGGSLPPTPLTAAEPARDDDPRAGRVEVGEATGGDVELLGIPSVRLRITGDVVELSEATSALGEFREQLPSREVGDVLVGEIEPLGSLVGGAIGGIGEDAEGDDEDGVHVFVRLVHREAGEVVNLQEGAVRVDLSENPVTVDVPMPGTAYTIPAGEHLDLEIATGSTVHATGRAPAIIDVEVLGEIPVLGELVAPDDGGDGGTPNDDRPAGAPDGGDDGAAARRGAAMPATGGGLGSGAVLALAAVVALRRER